MAFVFKREGAGIANRWYAKIRVGKFQKVIRLDATYSGPGSVRKDKALAMAIEAELAANKADEEMIRMDSAMDFAHRVMALSGHRQTTKTKTVKEFFADFLYKSELAVAAGTLAAGTEKTRKVWTKKFLAYAGSNKDKKFVLCVTYDFVAGFIDDQRRKGEVEASTLLTGIKNLAPCCSSLVKRGELSHNPFSGHEIAVADTERVQMTKADAEALIKTGDEPFDLVMTIMLCTGVRVGDAVSLTLENFDLEKKLLTFTPDKQKAGKERVLCVPICERLVRTLNEKGHILGKLKTKKPFQDRWNKFGEKLELTKGITPHATRHFFVSMLANAGVVEETRMKLVGHSSGRSRVHSLYTHLEGETVRAELAKVDWLK